jgi:hypothetical protein
MGADLVTVTEPWISRAGTTARMSTTNLPRGFQIRVRVEEDAPQWLAYVMSRLNSLGGQVNEADPWADEEALERALHDLATVLEPEMPAPSVVPSEEHGVLFVWHRAGWDVEIEVRAGQTIAWATNPQSSAEIYGDLADVRPEIRRVLRELTGRA